MDVSLAHDKCLTSYRASFSCRVLFLFIVFMMAESEVVIEDVGSDEDSVCEESIVTEEREGSEEENGESEVEAPKQLTEKEIEGQKKKMGLENMLKQAKIPEERVGSISDLLCAAQYDTISRISTLTDDDLKALGVKILGDRLKIRYIAKEAKKIVESKRKPRKPSRGKTATPETPPKPQPQTSMKDFVESSSSSLACVPCPTPQLPSLFGGLADTIEAEQNMIFEACRNKDINAVMGFIQQGARVDIPHKDGSRLLHLACEGNDLDMVKMLVLGAKADIDQRDNKGYSALHVAAKFGCLEAIKLLVQELGANIESTDFLHGSRPIHIATKYGHKDAVGLLRFLGADVKARDLEYSWTCLLMAVAEGHSDVILHLLHPPPFCVKQKEGEEEGKNEGGEERGEEEDLELLEMCDDYQFNAVHVACMMNQPSSLLTLLTLKTTQEKQLIENMITQRDTRYHRTPLHVASLNGSLQCTKMLIQHNKQQNNLLTCFEMKDNRGCSPLFLSTLSGNWDIVIEILKNGGRMDDIDKKENTLLHIFAASHPRQNDQQQHQQFLELTNTPPPSFSSSPSLSSISEEGVMEVILKRVEEEGREEIKKRNVNGDTPLHIAAMEGKVALLRELCVKGGDLTTQNNQGNTPLHLASVEGDLETVSYLVEACPEVLEKRNLANETAEDIAKQKSYDGVVEILIQQKLNEEK